jgi:hypothetical protein
MKLMKIKTVKLVENNNNVYDIQLEKNHYFSANGIYTHNCRLKNNFEKAKEYTNSFGVGGLSIGSHRVVTLNLPQIAYQS